MKNPDKDMKKGKGEERNWVRELGEDLLKEAGQAGDLEATWRGEALLPKEEWLRIEAALEYLKRAGQIIREGEGHKLTAEGRQRTVELLRAHRLMETYLARRKGLRADELHKAADREEHAMNAEGINALADSLNRPRFDPHGDVIPEREKDLYKPEQVGLREAPVGGYWLIAHIEDEPEEDFAELMEMGLAPELPFKILSHEGGKTVIELAGEACVLSDRLAEMVDVRPMDKADKLPLDLRRLSSLKTGESGTVAFISAGCMGPERRRLQDFGMVPGSRVQCEFSSPFGSPVAYSVRGTSLGLRKEQASKILIRRNP